MLTAKEWNIEAEKANMIFYKLNEDTYTFLPEGKVPKKYLYLADVVKIKNDKKLYAFLDILENACLKKE